MTYVDGFLIPVREDKRQAYHDLAAFAAPIFMEYGALEVVECWGDDMMRGETTDFFMAVKATEEENVVFSWIIWPDRETRDRGNAAAMADERFKIYEFNDIVDGKRMIFSGFTTLVQARSEGAGE